MTTRFSKKFVKAELESMRIHFGKYSSTSKEDMSNAIITRVAFIDFLLKRWKLEKHKD